MIRAAGILFQAPDGKVLFLKRGPGDHEGEWCFPGGKAEDDESAEATAVRETIEEVGFLPAGERALWTRRIAEDVDFATFLQRTPEKVIPRLSDEHTAYSWAEPTDPPEPLHPGIRIALARFTMNEFEVAQAIAAGELTSPQRVGGFSLWALRVTGTGTAYRNSLDEYVYRPPEHYLTPEFLARCNGLQVIWLHTAKGGLDSAQFEKQSVGAIVLPYIVDDDVWGIAKIYNDKANEALEAKQLSTSPMVAFGSDNDNATIKLADGKRLLIEDDPKHLDHLALCPLGVWDKGPEPTGVLNHSLNERADSMADETAAEKEAREAAAKKDANPGIEPDKLLAKLDSVLKRMDEMDARDAARKDAEEKAKLDAAMKDAAARRDAEREPWMKADAAQCALDDAEEAAKAEEIEKGGEPKEVAADKARKDRKDRMDARRKDAESMEDKAKKDAADKEAREDAARKDAQAVADKARADSIAADAAAIAKGLASMPMRHDAAGYAEMADIQARADAQAYQPLGLQAPAPLQGETPTAFRVRSLRGVQKHSKPWSGVDLHTLQDAALSIAEGQIYADAALASHSVDGLPEDELVATTRVGEGGHKITEFRGRHTYIMGLKRPSLRATAFLTANKGA
jgi:8-oxo-dGTP pyrophosphatase MutT (NUDIX family)